MTDTARNILEKKNLTVIEKSDLETLMKDRLDFGFDSIYFRYAIAMDELAMLRARQSHDLDREQRRANSEKMRFYNALEQLVHAHPMEDRNGINK